MNVHQDLAKAMRAQRQFQSDHGREPTDDELASILDMKVSKLRRVLMAAKTEPVSMETPRGFSSTIGGSEAKFNARNGGRRKSKAGQVQSAAPVSAAARTFGRTMTLEDTLESAEPGADRAVEMSLLHGAITEAFKDLDEDEQKVISLRYGLEDGIACSRSQAAERCEQSKEWVRSCEMRAMTKLRKPHHLMMLRPYNSQRQSLTAVPS
jgi:DNA-directed RNA polymerase sigma subunit (sigma70/sigma32)